MFAMKTLLALGAIVFALAGCDSSDSATTDMRGTKLQQAYDDCTTTYSNNLNVEDSGHTLTVAGAKNEEDFTKIACIFLAIDTPDFIVTEMDSTTAMMGRQTEEADDFTYRWSYHPDNGMDIVVTEN